MACGVERGGDHMRLGSSAPVEGEPDGGWVGASGPLVDTELLQTVLCRFTGRPVGFLGCLTREQRLHPDVDCQAVYFQSHALLDGRLAASQMPTAEEIRAPWSGGEPTAGDHLLS